MEGVSVASVAREPTHELDSVQVAFLVAADQEREVERIIEDLPREWHGRIDVQLLGAHGGIRLHRDRTTGSRHEPVQRPLA